MKNFIKLLNFEINRFSKLYFLMLAVIFIIQFGSVIFHVGTYMALVKAETQGGRMSPEQFLYEYYPFGLNDIIYTRGFLVPIAIGVVGLLFYMFFIWYRDWFARNTFVYRLLMLPTSRMNIFYAKLTTIMLTVLTTVALQLIFLSIYQKVIEWTIPVVYRVDVSVGLTVATSQYLTTIIPDNLNLFFIGYGLGLAIVVVIFTAILFERSFQLIGIIYGIIYVGMALITFITPFIIQLILFDTLYLYTDEMLYLLTAIVIGIVIVSLFVSRYLLNNKVTV